MLSERVEIPSRSLPVFRDADVVIVGGGASGVAAALAASRHKGVRCVLIERANCAGGMMTNGLLPSIIYMRDGKNLLSGGLCAELVKRVAARMGVPVNYDWFNIHPEAVKIVLDEMLEESGIEFFYNTYCCEAIRRGNHLESIVISTPSGLAVIRGKIFIDATGDGNLSALADVPYELGDENNEVMSPTLCSMWSGVDYDKTDPGCNGSGYGRMQWHLLQESGAELPIPENHFVGFFRNGAETGIGNLGHAYGCRPLDVESYTRACVESRRLCYRFLDFYRQSVPGFAKAELVQTASVLGIRESRRVKGEYQLNGNDYASRRHFSDDVGCFAYPIDIHASSGDLKKQAQVESNLNQSAYKDGENYGIPYRCLLAYGIDNLLLSGRCISADRSIQSSIRVVPGCMLAGEAAGAASALAVEGGHLIREIDVSSLQAELIKNHIYIK